MRPSRFEHRELLKENGVIGLASELVEYEKKYDDVVHFLLGRILVTEDLDYASLVARKSNYRVRIVTKDGQVINAGGSFTGGYSGRNAGVFSRKGEIDALEQKIAQTLEDTKDDREKKDNLLSEIEALENDLQKLQDELALLREDRIRTEAEESRVSAIIDSLKHNLELADQEIEQIGETRGQKKNDIARLESEIALRQSDAERYEQNLANSDSPDGFMERRTELMEIIAERKLTRT
ncbi:MAG: chromosome segregation protein SMC, partial [Oscillospiraceae bacterium]|nr:chromosome segregation protein SMC [Oscillospiraceae bacterium]